MGLLGPRNMMGAMLMSLMASHRTQLDPAVAIMAKEAKPRKCPRCATLIEGRTAFCSPECARKRLPSPIAGRKGKGTRKQRKAMKQR